MLWASRLVDNQLTESIRVYLRSGVECITQKNALMSLSL